MAWTKKGKLKKRVRRQTAYLDYFEKKRKAGKVPMTLYRWKRTGKASARTKAVKKRLRRSLTEEEVGRFTR